jgi:hypothetical protein
MRSDIARRTKWLLPALLAFVLGACDNPIDLEETEHLEAMEVILRNPQGGEIARSNVIDDNWIGGPLVFQVGVDTDVRVIWLDFEGHEFTLEGRAPEFSLRLVVEDGGILATEVLDGHARLRGLAPGETRMRYVIYHVDHPDFQSPWVDVAVVGVGGR